MRELSPADNQPEDFEEPEILADRYVLGAELGVGATARVYQAWDPVLGVSRAVKLLSVPDTYRAALRERLHTEARAMARLNHPNVLRVYDIKSLHDDDFVVMELAEGGSLQALVDAEGALPMELACDYILQILSALGAAHQAGVVHRDVKPQNILLNTDGQALLADFGIALLEDADRNTRTGAAMGSMSYMAPEQRVDARLVGPAADIYATGATLYHLLTAANPIDLFASPSFSPRWTALPTRLRPVVQRAAAYDPAKRYPSAGAMALDLRSALLSECDIELTDGMGFSSADADRTLPPEAYADLARDPSTLFDIPGSHSRSLEAVRTRQEQREALYALPLTLGGLFVSLACWFLGLSLLQQAPLSPTRSALTAAPPVLSADASPGEDATAADAATDPGDTPTTAASPLRGGRARAEVTEDAVAATLDGSAPQPEGFMLANGKPRPAADVLGALTDSTGVSAGRVLSPAAGRWQGRLGGQAIELLLDGAEAMQGALILSPQEKTDVSARYDDDRRALRVQLRLPENWPTISEGELRLSSDAETLTGRVQVDGQMRLIRLQRVATTL